MKTCRLCFTEKPLTDFYGHIRSGIRSECKACSKAQAEAARKRRRIQDRASYNQAEREAKRLRMYGLSPEQYAAKLASQAYCCGMCGVPFSDEQPPNIDHDHSCCPGKKSCGKCVRDMLCRNCNLGLGYFNDSIDRLQYAIAYLQKKEQL